MSTRRGPLGVVGQCDTGPSSALARDTHGQLDRLPFAVLLALLLGLWLAALDQSIVATALPTIGGDLGHLDQVSWVATTYLLAWAVATPICGKLGDLYGRRRLFVIAIAAFVVASCLCGMSDSIWMLAILRGVQGAGGGALLVGGQGIIADLLWPSARGRYTGLVSAVFVGATVAGPVIGGWLVDHVSWRSIFYINVPIGAVALALVLTRLPVGGVRTRTSRAGKNILDVRGAVLLATGVTSLVLLLSLSPLTLLLRAVLFALSLSCVAGLIYVEARVAEPILPLYMLRDRLAAGANLVSLAIGMAWFGATIFLPLYFQVVRGSSATHSGLQLLPLILGLLASSTFAGRMLSRASDYRFFPIVGTALACVGLYCVSLLDRLVSDGWLDLSMLLIGLGVGLVTQVMVVLVQNEVRPEDLGVATAMVTFSRAIGSAIGVAVLGSVFASRLDRILGTQLGGIAGRRGGFDPRVLEMNPVQVRRLPGHLAHAVVHAFPVTLHSVFLIATAFGLASAVSAWVIPKPARPELRVDEELEQRL
jgi:EmrB/QacA subfamily drug resistance transporter